MRTVDFIINKTGLRRVSTCKDCARTGFEMGLDKRKKKISTSVWVLKFSFFTFLTLKMTILTSTQTLVKIYNRGDWIINEKLRLPTGPLLMGAMKKGRGKKAKLASLSKVLVGGRMGTKVCLRECLAQSYNANILWI